MNNNLASHGTNYSENDILFANFNQNCSSVVVGSRNGFKVFHITSVDSLELIFDNKGEIKDVSLVDRLFSSSLVAIVSMASPRKLIVCHFKKGTEICNYSYSNTILAVKMSRIRLVVLLEETILIHNIRDMKVLHTIRDTPSNPKGLCCLSTASEKAFVVYPGSCISGEVQIFDVVNLRAVSTINAHNSPLAAMTFNESATKLATASVKGTVIRVFSVPDGQKLFEFRRGVKRCVSIGSLCFSPDSLFLCASSNTETVHVFKLDQVTSNRNAVAEEGSSWMDYLSKVWTSSASYLPTQVTEVLNQDRAFATVKLPFSGIRNVCAIVVIQKLPRVLVVGGDGYLYIYNLDPVDGGECTLLRQHSLNQVEYAGDSAPATIFTSSHHISESPPHFQSSSPSVDHRALEALAAETEIVSLNDKTEED